MQKISLVAGLAVLLAACGGEKAPEQTPAAVPAADTAAPAATAAVPTGATHDVRMEFDGKTYHFIPATLTIKAGDVVNFHNISGGPHNVALISAMGMNWQAVCGPNSLASAHQSGPFTASQASSRTPGTRLPMGFECRRAGLRSVAAARSRAPLCGISRSAPALPWRRGTVPRRPRNPLRERTHERCARRSRAGRRGA